jgi:hypothetical protein
MKENEDGVGQLDFLFCEKCDRHVGDSFYLKQIQVSSRPLTEEEKKKRVAPIIDIKAKPMCGVCESPLVQKYVVIKGTVTI